ncbi:YHYH protein [Thalassomonas sp. M1454]|uniref:YHYH protein n=1 Tax=Thalassomonas sp. M1454 TaxID=2594477 RepID=UPI00118156C1|nr:YHYH protein [Thalassomonas sp. M1454]TRX56671.1 sulfatase-like hydrolase/transferase [Thalassomonas sp. M1454]
MKVVVCLLSIVFLISCGGASSDSPAEIENITAQPDVSDDTTADDGNDGEVIQPNILLIISDDQGLDASAQYPYSTDQPNTPNLNYLAEQGIVFDNAWATPGCTTTRASILTGMHGVNSGVSFIPATLDTSLQTLPKYLKSDPLTSNYQMAVFGKWHLAGGNPDPNHPFDSGIDHYAGNLSNVADYYQWQLTQNGETSEVNQYHTSKITDLVIDWTSQQTSPWLAWVAYSAPHAPFHLPPEELHSRADLTGEDNDINNNKREYYLAAIEAMDSEIGRLLNSFHSTVYDNTIIIFIGDNGTPRGVIDTSVYAQSHSKFTLYEGGIRVPLVISGKGVERGGEREKTLVNSTDLFTTIAQLAGSQVAKLYDSSSFKQLLSNDNTDGRAYNYSEFDYDGISGWSIRNDTYKLLEYESGVRELYDISTDVSEETNLLLTTVDYTAVVIELSEQALIIRGEQQGSAIDITNQIFTNRNNNCSAYVESYSSNVMDVNNSALFSGDLTITLAGDKCIFTTNAIPNHDFNDGDEAFPNDVSAQNDRFEITTNPTHANSITALSLLTDNAILLNGVKVDILAAGCYGVGNGKVGCNDINQPWRFDPMSPSAGFRVDSHNAHSQPDGTYHYHGTPNAFYHAENNGSASPVVGFAADGYPIFGPYFDASSDGSGEIRKAVSSYRIIDGSRPATDGSPGGEYDGTFRDDNEYIAGLGDLDECNGMTVNGVYGYYITDTYPYVLSCFKGTPDPSFNK